MDGRNSGKQAIGGSPMPVGNPQQASKPNVPNSVPSSEPLFRWTDVSEMYRGRAIINPPSSDWIMTEPCKLYHGYISGCPLGFNCPDLKRMYGREIGNPSRKRKVDELYYGFPPSGSKRL